MKTPLKFAIAVGIAGFIIVCIGVGANSIRKNDKCQQHLNKTEKDIAEFNEFLKKANSEDALLLLLDPSVQEKLNYFDTVTSKDLTDILDNKVCSQSRGSDWLQKNQTLIENANSNLNLLKGF